mmetsp:Transcript_13327/g.20100  ORF Transcript_13327/g.20100 Transcript_13327/m.20100 type:complete len:209 (+) Transcript_13327:236-862(+)
MIREGPQMIKINAHLRAPIDPRCTGMGTSSNPAQTAALREASMLTVFTSEKTMYPRLILVVQEWGLAVILHRPLPFVGHQGSQCSHQDSLCPHQRRQCTQGSCHTDVFGSRPPNTPSPSVSRVDGLTDRSPSSIHITDSDMHCASVRLCWKHLRLAMKSRNPCLWKNSKALQPPGCVECHGYIAASKLYTTTPTANASDRKPSWASVS